jgi:integrase
MSDDWRSAISSLEELLEGASAAALSPSRLRQMRWVKGELACAAATDLLPAPSAGDLVELLSPAVVTDYLAFASAGQLRSRTARRPTQDNPNSTRVRLRCLQLFAEQAGLSLLMDTPAPTFKEPVSPRSRHLMMRDLGALVGAAEGKRRHPELARLYALVGVVLDTGARVGELCAMTEDDISRGLARLDVTRRPQAAGARNTVETYELSERTKLALRSWLAARDGLVSTLEGSTSALWVSVRHNHLDGSTPWPAGLPLRPRGLSRAYARIVEVLNTENGGVRGWEPLPRRMEQLRRTPPGEPAPRPVRSHEGP